MRREDTPAFLHEFLHDRAAPLLDSFRDWAAKHDHFINDPNLGRRMFADHFSYKCREFREFAEIRGRFEEHDDGWRASRFIYQSIVSGRRVAVIGLVDPIVTPMGDLRVLELSEPKPMSAAIDGFDHVEVVTIEELRWTALVMNDSSSMLKSPFILKERPHHVTWDAKILPDRRRRRRQPFILRLTDEPLVAKIGVEMR